MDQITARKNGLRRDLHLREGMDKYPISAKQFKSTDFIGQKSQGGGIYSVTAKSRRALMTPVRLTEKTHLNNR
jgi:hypothetical protein